MSEGFKPVKLYEENSRLKITKGSMDGRKLRELRKNALKDMKFWEEQANSLTWFKGWNNTLEWNPPFARWFVDGLINASYNILDKHMETNVKNKIAILWEGENEERRKLTYNDLYIQVNKFANGLKKLGNIESAML